MGDSLRYTTVDSSRAILAQLYIDDKENPFFPCEIRVSIRHKDSTEETTKTLYIERMGHNAHSHENINGERSYRTRARIVPNGEPFDVEITIHAQQFDTAGATIIPSRREVYKVIENHVLDGLT